MNELELFWNRFKLKFDLEETINYKTSFHFELTEKWANELLRLVLIGQKKATASSLYSFEIENEPLPSVGDYHIVTDFSGKPRCVIMTTGILIIPFNKVTYDICMREGEDLNLESWQKGHTKFFTSEGREMGYSFKEDMPILFEDFEMVYSEE